LENVIDEGVDDSEDEGSEVRVPVGKPSGMKVAGQSVVVAVHWAK
jgi:hypothetical protein